MKKLFTLVICSLALLLQASAQIKKGEKLLGGYLLLMVDNSEYDHPNTPEVQKTKSTSFGIHPQLGFGLGDNWIAGIRMAFTYHTQKQESGFGNPRSEGYVIQPGGFVRKYFPIGDRFGMFGQADVGWGYGIDKYNQDNEPTQEYKKTTYGIGLTPGASFRVSKRFVIEAAIGGIGYSRYSSKPKAGTTGSKIWSDDIIVSLSNNLSLGFQLIL